MRTPEKVEAAALNVRIKELLGYDAHVQVSEAGMVNSATKIVDMEVALTRGTTKPADVQAMVWPVLQMVSRLAKAEERVRLGSQETVENRAVVQGISLQFNRGGLSPEEIRDLSIKLYANNPRLGAERAVQVLEKLHALYPGIALR